MQTNPSNSVSVRDFLDLDQQGRVQAEYIWLGGTRTDIRSKTRTLPEAPKSVAELPDWNYDGSSTNQAPGHNSEVILKPRAIFRDPFRRGENILVVCDTYTPEGEPLPTNSRAPAVKIFDQAPEDKPWYGMEQEYTLFEKDGRTPLGWPAGMNYPRPQGPYYCSVGTENAIGRQVVEAHYRCCLYAGVTISGSNAEVMAGQWEYQVGPCVGIDAGDHMTVGRYLMHRVCEHFGVICSFDPKPIEGDWNGAGCHCNFSTEAMRQEGGEAHILAAIENLGKKHHEHIAAYGEGNERRLTGKHETASIDKFSWGYADRGCSIRVPSIVKTEHKGYLEDRRPASSCDPYRVSSMIFQTIKAF